MSSNGWHSSMNPPGSRFGFKNRSHSLNGSGFLFPRPYPFFEANGHFHVFTCRLFTFSRLSRHLPFSRSSFSRFHGFHGIRRFHCQSFHVFTVFTAFAVFTCRLFTFSRFSRHSPFSRSKFSRFHGFHDIHRFHDQGVHVLTAFRFHGFLAFWAGWVGG